MDFKVNGVKIKTPTAFQIDFNPISDGERLLDGTMCINGVASKLTLTLQYDTITDTELLKVLGCTWDKLVSSKIITQEVSFPYIGGGVKTIRSYFAPTSVKLDRSGAVAGVWKSFTMKFIEL